ncbi:hypothetical protein HG536_0F02440 [Torulaspora globosa]|uniref:1-phosphatidylinositol-3-phosphate 5-kinase n=1 Tax=Torulaspora globosa TaxID=48254 RepID=A0A7G3ZK83_9SACH|nr:uncharacterized protein HG536_0F02440 [Torulaspora globosa]QLL33919.1 hypothetical protein HG536_0F02440 [Torulaspora globosa]
MKGAIDKPEFLATDALIPKTTTDLDTNPVMSDLSVPLQMNIGTEQFSPNSNATIEQVRSESSTDIDELSQLEPVENKDTTAVSHEPNKTTLHRHSGPALAQGRSLTFSLDSNARAKRSSIYESKSTVTAIPIRNPTNSMRQHYRDNEDALSMKSGSSSMTASLSRSFLFGFYHNRKKNQKNTKSVISKEYWMKDDSAKECFTCGKSFNTFRRRHHCRICGQIFCNSCTFSVSGERFGSDGTMRVCNHCYEHANNYEDSSDEESAVDQASHYRNSDDRYIFAAHEKLPSQHLGDHECAAGDPVICSHNQDDIPFDDDADAQSVITTAEGDSRLLVSTPPPPPKMAIPATRQGESLEISFPVSNTLTDQWHHDSIMSSGHGLRDRYTIKDVDMLSSFDNNHAATRPSPSKSNGKPSKHSLRRSLFNYVGNNRPTLEKAATTGNANNIIGNVDSKNYKFEFNYRKGAHRGSISSARRENPLQRQQSDSKESNSSPDDDTSEDEGSMSIYSALNDTMQSSNPIRSMRTSTKSFQRAEASLQRMRFRRKSKSKPNLTKSHSFHSGWDLFNNSTPNLISIVNEDKAFAPFSNEANTIQKPKGKIGLNGSWKRVSSPSIVTPEGKNELSEVSSLHMEALLDQVLNDQNLDGKNEWKELLKEFFLKIQAIRLNARDSGTLDFRQNYVKIKRIPGGNFESSEYINGIVFSKALPCKLMPRILDSPRILLIMFPLEYQRNENHFLSLKTVMAQEKEYLDKLVARLTSLGPNVLLVGANVSGYAMELLTKEGVVVQFNLKPQVIERIAKLTEADIAISVDKLAGNIKMGACERFEVKSFIYQNVSKTYTFIRGCNRELGGTVLLRGENEEILRKLKDVSEFMVYVVFSLKLESALFNDNFLKLSTNHYLEGRRAQQQEKLVGYFSEFMEKFRGRILTTSPSVEFPIPFLLKRARELEQELIRKRKEFAKLGLDEETAKIFGAESQSLISTLTKKDCNYLVNFVHEKELSYLELQFQRKNRQWEVSYAQSRNMLGTGSHQCITLLYSMVSTKTATPCIGPQLVTIDYFWDSDISIGQFIENVVATAFYPCRQGCGGELIDHYRSYVHGSGKVDVLIEKFQARLPRLRDIIVTWSYCKKCGATTPILQVSEKTWNYSFGKYLELMFWSKKESVAGIGKCIHDFATDHVKYFGFNGLVVRIDYSDLEVHELVTPPRKITWTPYKDIKMKVELYYQILDKINAFYDSVLSRLERVKLDSMSGDRLLAGQSAIEELKSKVGEEKALIIQDLERLYRKEPGDQHIHLNFIIKTLHDRAVSWDSEFTDFGKRFLPSETDITRITSRQLKKLFSDFKPEEDVGQQINTKKEIEKSDNSSCPNSNESPITGQDVEELRAMLSAGDKPPLQDKPEDGAVSAAKVSDDEESAAVTNVSSDDHFNGNDAPLSVNKSFDKGVVSNLINSRNVSTTSNSSSVGRRRSTSTKVGQLANFFDQMHFDALSKEFELQREKERVQLNKNKYQALRLHTSTPIVEIYKNVKDAVNEPLHDLAKYKDSRIKDTTDKVTGNSNKHKMQQKLESQLENSIHQWGEQVLQEDHEIPKHETPSIIVSTDGKEINTSEPLPPVTTSTTANKDGSNNQPEKSLLMKALANFWADRSASLWKPLNYPTLPTEHIFVDNDVIIREDEPSSLIAFCLNTSDYKQKMANLENMQQPTSAAPTEFSTDTSANGSESIGIEKELNISRDSFSNSHAPSEVPVSMEPQTSKIPAQPTVSESGGKLESIMTKSTAVHLRYQFEDALTVMSCKIFFAEHFDAFRRICGCHEKFIQSLSRCVKWDSSGGKSGSGFLKTLDDRFVIKELSHSELDAFIKFTPSYFEYMAQAMFHDLPTALAKIFGFYQIQVKSSISGSKSYKMDVIIMENLFYERKISRIFDLKGSMRNRHVEQTGKENEVLLDENMVEYIYESPIYVREYDKKLLRASLWNDTLFLAKMNVMDYSLVVGIDNEGHTLTVGIIDFIRTFTWDKKLENWVKEKGLVGGSSSKKPTVVTPKQYKNRFREAMERYILMVPDPWYQGIF